MELIRKFDNKILLWASLGPFIILLTFLVGLTKGVCDIIYLPILGILGIPACLLWKREGLIASIAVIVVALAIGYNSVAIGDKVWTMGLAIALILGLIITRLSIEEATTKIRSLQQKGLDNFNRVLELDDLLQQEQRQWDEEREGICDQMDTVVASLEQHKDMAVANGKLINVLRDECKQLTDHKAKLLEELFTNQKENTQLRQKLDECNALLEENDDARISIVTTSTLQNQLRERNQELEQARRSLKRQDSDINYERKEKESLRQECHAKDQTIQELQEKIEDFQREQQELHDKMALMKLESDELIAGNMDNALQEEKTRADGLQETLQKVQQELVDKQQQLQRALEEQVQAKQNQQNLQRDVELEKEVDVQEKRPLNEYERNLRYVEGMYKQLRAQFEEKKHMLHLTRASLFNTENNLLALKKEKEHEKLKVDALQERLQRDLIKVESEERQVEEENCLLEEIITSLTNKLTDNSKIVT